MSKELVCLTGISAGYSENAVLHNINWRIISGEHWIISGSMASGKSSLCKVLVGRIRTFEGNVQLPFLSQHSSEARYRLIKMVSFTDSSKLFHGPNAVHYYQQRYHAFDSEGHLTVREYLHHSGFEEPNPYHVSLLNKMGLLKFLDYERIKLSSGQTRKLLLAKAMLTMPRIIVLDNPYMGLDTSGRQIFNDLIDELAKESAITFILSGHYHELPKCISHQLHLNAGRVFYAGVRRDSHDLETTMTMEIDDFLVKQIRTIYQKNVKSPDYQKVVDLQNVSIRYLESTIFENVNWTIYPGDKWVLSGSNGSGKSTLLSLMYADHPQAYAQKIYLFDRLRGTGENIWEVKRRFGFSSSELHAYFTRNYTVEQIILSGFKDGFQLTREKGDMNHLMDLFLRYFAMMKYKFSRFNELSTGMQRLTLFIRSLIKIPEVLLLDEPYQGMDRLTIFKCNSLLENILSQNHTLLFISHFSDEIPSIVDQEFTLGVNN